MPSICKKYFNYDYLKRLLSKFIKSTENGYTLETSKTDEELECPEHDFTARKINENVVEIKVSKNVKIKSS